MNSTNKIVLASSLAALGGLILYQQMKPKVLATCVEECPSHALMIISPQKMYEILEDWKIRLVPYYTYYYNVLKQLEQEYLDRYQSEKDENQGMRSRTLYELKAKIKEELDQKHLEIQTLVIEDEHKLTKERFTYSAKYYSTGTTEILAESGYTLQEVNVQIKEELQILMSQYDTLFPQDIQQQVSKPDFQLSIPPSFTSQNYIQIISKIFACVRYSVYKEIRQIIRTSGKTQIIKAELTDIMKKLDLWDIRNKVFDLYGFGEVNEPTHRTLMKVHLSFLAADGSKEFEQEIRELRQSHQRYLTAILSADVFPGVEKTDPLETTDKDEIPDKFGKKWYQYQVNESNKTPRENGLEEMEDDINQMKSDILK